MHHILFKTMLLIMATIALSTPAFAFVNPALLVQYQASLSMSISIGEDQEHEQDTTLPISIVEQCYAAWNRRDTSAAAACFSDEFVYDDGQYLGSISKKSELQRRFQAGLETLPSNSMLVVDHMAVCSTTGNIGAQWHAERPDDTIIPLTRGCSFYTTDETSGLITSGFKVSEMVIKPSKTFSNRLVSSASNLMQSKSANPKVASTSGQTSSIIEDYFEAWNRRDMEAALNCFVDDCIYQVEDSVFVDTFRGKTALGEHLVNNAAALPSSCKIILDDLAIDSKYGKFGVKWHLEVNGVIIPNLRGCSMYTMDSEVGLLKTGFDVTEAPVKLPGLAQRLVSLPSKLGLFT
mmetsp:Transcript_4907/g.7194  ORF Transcript_4907/g.7194 Transcript_4907/m.7194 type:complete len:349 (-) Transcript_4907:216-1262(-)|eukprot:CAMPEP_0194119206 /NCGR_PEP_ID=MMETSP0150-20130528/38396_1 /TAXON_ID=122233 /ORGANISM="Chaetoceros debilis, Strain MM31A-1" /LENGTH=348 /DNA_ID=CAMNT_0038810827 /DNA_START=48 /DNA_END=1094 /DNA_ORIENTATION=+